MTSISYQCFHHESCIMWVVTAGLLSFVSLCNFYFLIVYIFPHMLIWSLHRKWGTNNELRLGLCNSQFFLRLQMVWAADQVQKLFEFHVFRWMLGKHVGIPQMWYYDNENTSLRSRVSESLPHAPLSESPLVFKGAQATHISELTGHYLKSINELCRAPPLSVHCPIPEKSRETSNCPLVFGIHQVCNNGISYTTRGGAIFKHLLCILNGI